MLAPSTADPRSAVLETRQDPLERARARIVKERATFHVFQDHGKRILYDLWSGSLLELTESAWIVLDGLERRQSTSKITERLERHGHGDALPGVVKELEILCDNGFFLLEPLETPEERRATLDALVAQAPRSTQVLVQTSCNLSCSYCYEVKNGFHGTGGRMSSEIGRRAVDLMFERSRSRRHLDVNFFGGEPLLNLKLVRELVGYAEARAEREEKQVSFKMTTNGVLLDDDAIAFLVEKQFGVMLSLDGPPEKNDVHRRDHKGRGSGEQVLENAKRLISAQRRAGVREACIRATMTAGNESFDELADYFEAQGFRRVMIGASNGRAEEKDSFDLTPEMTPEREERKDRQFERIRDAIRGTGPRLPRGFRTNESLKRIEDALTTRRNHRRSIMCGVGRNMTAATASGKLYPCHRYAGDQAFEIGDVHDGVDDTKLEAYYSALLRGYDSHCSGCWARFICGGQCPWYVSRDDGSIVHPDEAGCDGIRTGAEGSLALYLEARAVTERGASDASSKRDI